MAGRVSAAWVVGIALVAAAACGRAAPVTVAAPGSGSTAGSRAVTPAVTTAAPTTPAGPYRGDLRDALLAVPANAYERFDRAGRDRGLSLDEAVATFNDRKAARAEFTELGFRPGAVRQWQEKDLTVVVIILYRTGPGWQAARFGDLRMVVYHNMRNRPVMTSVPGVTGAKSYVFAQDKKERPYAVAITHRHDVVVEVVVSGHSTTYVKRRVEELMKGQVARLS